MEAGPASLVSIYSLCKISTSSEAGLIQQYASIFFAQNLFVRENSSNNAQIMSLKYVSETNAIKLISQKLLQKITYYTKGNVARLNCFYDSWQMMSYILLCNYTMNHATLRRQLRLQTPTQEEGRLQVFSKAKMRRDPQISGCGPHQRGGKDDRRIGWRKKKMLNGVQQL